eukprot:TRINITY_DN1224_c0_g1_i1.p1 TRINITY_DN1224_c0_g1~~TRINITY_DN1224_c0_g1_i1.p1  ORF type:complete len:703 (+),score=219.55 TRINITY_DN1224_c0_g1_i1:95-2110(+)
MSIAGVASSGRTASSVGRSISAQTASGDLDCGDVLSLASLQTESTEAAPEGAEAESGRPARIPNTSLLLVEFPGHVRNTPESRQTALEMLGGSSALAAAYTGEEQHPRMCFRPLSAWPRPTFGKASNSAHLYVSVRVRTKRAAIKRARMVQDGPDGPALKHARITTKLLGVVRRTLRFRNLCDFQWVPPRGLALPVPGHGDLAPLMDFVNRAATGGDTSLRHVPVQPLFLPPKLFSRCDTPQDYNYQDNPNSALVRVTHPDGQEDVQRVSSAQPVQSKLVKKDWTDEDIPSGPDPQAVEALERHPRAHSAFQKLQELFRRRPIWSRTALSLLLSPTGHDISHLLRLILPCVSFTYTTGPYRQLYVRFGYNPRAWRRPQGMEGDAEAAARAQGDEMHPALLELMDLRLGRLSLLKELQYVPQTMDRGTPMRVHGPGSSRKAWPAASDPVFWDRIPLNWERLFELYSSGGPQGPSRVQPAQQKPGTIFMQYADCEDQDFRRRVVQCASPECAPGNKNVGWLSAEKTKLLRRELQEKYRGWHAEMRQRLRVRAAEGSAPGSAGSLRGSEAGSGPTPATTLDAQSFSRSAGSIASPAPRVAADEEDDEDDEGQGESEDGIDATGLPAADVGDDLGDGAGIEDWQDDDDDDEEDEELGSDAGDDDNDIFDRGLLDD